MWLKAVKSNGMNDSEISALTLAMAKSGTILSWEGLEPTVDKHSSGGIGDKITLLFAPLVAAYTKNKINIPKLSGRGLGISGGTIDKLESIPGLKTNLTIDEIKEQVKKIGLAVSSAGSDLAPADKRLYAIRDVTDTVDSIPLIASSIMSKKIAGGSKNIILDVKAGKGAFMKTPDMAKKLALSMVNIGKNLDKNITALITDMNQPLGYAVGNSLEILEVIEVLSGKVVPDLIEILILLSKEAIKLISQEKESDIESELLILLKNGSALKKFEEMIKAQSGDLSENSWPIKKANHIEVMKAEEEGYIYDIDAYIVGEAVHRLGAGREKVEDKIDHSVGILFYKKYGDKIKKEDALLEIHAKNKEDAQKAKIKLISAIKFGQKAPSKLKLIHEKIK